MNKWLYEFDAKNIIKKDDGSQETVVKKFSLLKPNRRLREDGELFYATETSRFAKAGVLPKAAWNTILSNGGGSISDQDRELYGNLLLKFRDLSFELQSILIKVESDRTETEKNRVNEILTELEEVRNDIQSFESSQIAIFENTAEAKARNKTILWWVMFLAFHKDGEDYKPLFEGDTYENKIMVYDNLEENENQNEFLLTVIRRITYLVTLWFLGKADTTEDFVLFDNSFSKEAEKTEIEKTEPDKIVPEKDEKVSEVSLIEEIKPE
jgi:hypothetical protein